MSRVLDLACYGNRLNVLRVCALTVLVLSSAVGLAQDPPQETPTAKITRADLAASYLRLEQAYFAAPPECERAAEINRGFDRATMAFFLGRSGEALKQIDALTESLQQPAASPEHRAAASLKVTADPPVCSSAQPVPKLLRVRSLYDASFETAQDLALVLRAIGPEDEAVWQQDLPVRCGPDCQVDESVAVQWPTADLPAGLYRLELGGRDQQPIEVGRFNVIDGPPLEKQRAGNRAELDRVVATTPRMKQALATCRARNELLSDQPSPTNSAQFLADLNALAKSVRDEVATLLAGQDPYDRRRGDYWRVLVDEKSEVPLRVYAPEAAVADEPVPLLVVLHGAGGDENMFPEAYGAGIIKQIADERRVLVASPSTYRFGSHPKRIPELVDALAHDYAIDRNRVYVLGHSMGAGATAALVRGRADAIAAACCMAGGNNFQSPKGVPPLLVLLAELDGVVPAKSVESAAQRAISAGMPVELKVVPNLGHTLVVGRELPGAVDWLLKHRNEDATQSK